MRGRERCRTSPDGTFETPHELLRIADYRIEATAEGYVKGTRDVWVELIPGDITAVPDLVLKQASECGQSRDASLTVAACRFGKAGVGPAGDAAARSDAEGRFRVRSVVEGPAFLFAEKPGYRFAARKIGSGGEPVELVMDRSDEPPCVTRKTVPWPIPRAEERAIARKLLEPILAAPGGHDPSRMRNRALVAMARVDPDRVLEMLEDRIVSAGHVLLCAAAIGRLEDNPARP